MIVEIKEMCENTSKIAVQKELQLNIQIAQSIIDKAVVNQSIAMQLPDFISRANAKLPNLTLYEKLVLHNEFIDILELGKLNEASRVLKLDEYTRGSYSEMKRISSEEQIKLYIQLQDELRPKYSELSKEHRPLPDLQIFLDDSGTNLIIWKFRILLIMLKRSA